MTNTPDPGLPLFFKSFVQIEQEKLDAKRREEIRELREIEEKRIEREALPKCNISWCRERVHDVSLRFCLRCLRNILSWTNPGELKKLEKVE